MTPDAARPISMPAETSLEVETEQVRQCFDINRTTTPLVVVSAALVWGFFYWANGDARAFVWAALVHTSQAYRFWRLRALSALDPGTPAFRPAFDRDFVWPLGMAGVIWGLAPWLLLLDLQPLHVAVIFMAAAGMATGSMGALAHHWPALLVFVLPILVGLMTRLAWLGGVGWMVAGIALIYTVAFVRFGRRQATMIGDALRARFENQALARQLERQMAEIVRLSAEKTRFLAAASHDLRQPMHSLSLLCANLRRDLAGTPQRDAIERMGRAIDGLAASFEVMLDLSKLDAGVITPRSDAMPVSRLFTALQDQFAPRAMALGMDLRLRAGAHVVDVDADLMLRMLANLVDNAIKYNRPGGRLHVGARRRGDRVLVTVRDSGIGIAPEHQARVFDEYYQVSNPERDRGKGLGMGLAIVRRLSQLQDVPLTMRSAPGCGTCFELSLPVARSMPAPTVVEASAAAIPSHAAGRALTILLLDDEADVLAAMRGLLEGQGHRCLAAGERDEALRHAGTGTVDLLIVDFRLRGDDDGLSVVEAYRTLDGSAVPAILVTGDTGPDRVRRIHESGLPVMFKPVRADELLRLVDRVAAGASAEPQS